MSQIKQKIFPSIIAITALMVSASAAFYSVSGLMKLFAGAPLAVGLMAGSLELAKLVTASLLHQYWTSINKYLKIYLSSATLILMVITSIGIYGFLSSAYQKTFAELSIVENERSFIQQKINFQESSILRYDKEIDKSSDNINTLSKTKSSSIQVRDTSTVSGFRQTISTTELRMAQNRINIEEKNREKIQLKRNKSIDSLQKFQMELLRLNTDEDVSGELGSLQYLSSITGLTMDKVINLLLLIIVFVFDPLAISLVIASNFAFSKIKVKKEVEVKPTITPKPPTPKPTVPKRSTTSVVNRNF